MSERSDVTGAERLQQATTIGFLTGTDTDNEDVVCRNYIERSTGDMVMTINPQRNGDSEPLPTSIIRMNAAQIEELTQTVAERRVDPAGETIKYKLEIEDRERSGEVQLFPARNEPDVLVAEFENGSQYKWTGVNREAAELGMNLRIRRTSPTPERGPSDITAVPDSVSPIVWVPWVVGGVIAAACIGANAYKCGSCSAEVEWGDAHIEVGSNCEDEDED